jgi:cellulose synthase/poly-beta-1,6-N-acetylglucosamine synthase-like glycosyltransferase
MIVVEVVFWAALGALVWTHAAYPLAAALAARVRRRPVRGEAATPNVTVIVAAYNEETVIERRLENLLALDYPADRLEIVVTSDASGDRTDELVEAVVAREPRVRLIRCPRAGKVAAQDRAVRETNSEILAFSDANATWSPDTLAKLVRSFADPEVAYVCGRLVLTDAAGSNREGVYWRFETWLRARRSALGSVTGGNTAPSTGCGGPTTSGRPALRSRPLAAVSDGSAWAPGRLRPGALAFEAPGGDRD